MYLKRLELHGFKSFAKRTVFEFPSPITAIVGPNGSGKSNCAEAVRWVLGEQSMKSLRGKRGEDLIFSGSHSAPRMSKASVSLVFDNNKKQFPIDFDEVILCREVYRDGTNEYMINGSRVRLKDIVELLAHVGLGSSQHHIISQGEADRILYASPKDRKEMIEDALSLKIYQIKRTEAERKLERTKENMQQTEALRKEIQPHLRFLKTQAAKFQKTEALRKELEEKYILYLSCEMYAVEAQEKALAEQNKSPKQDIAQLEKQRHDLAGELENAQESEKEGSAFQEVARSLEKVRSAKSKLEHERGRLDGMIEMARHAGKEGDEETIPREEVEELFAEIENILSSALEEDVIEQIHGLVNEALSRMSSFFSHIDSSAQKEEKGVAVDELLSKKREIESAFKKLEEKETNLLSQEKELGGALHEYQKKLRMRERALYEVDGKLNKAKDILRSLSIEEERVALRREEFLREQKEATHYLGERSIPKTLSERTSSELKKLRDEITRLKFKLEDAGGIDESILKELEEVNARDEFFEKELADLTKASSDLAALAEGLAEKLERAFEGGISKINKEFQKYFEMIFGGGKAELRVVKMEMMAEDGEQDAADLEPKRGARGRKSKQFKSGIDVYVNLPRKRIRGLDMLSGGERALTSIALLFALANVNPPPFLVLDEIDAALDENNSRKYGEMLRNLSKGTELVIITHNRESMRNSDILYGVTMGTDGISRILSLKIEEAEEYSK